MKGGIRTPLIVSGGPINKVGTHENALVNATDIFATLVDFAGGRANIPANSFSFKGLLNNNSKDHSRSFNYSEWKSRNGDESWTFRDSTHKVIYHNANKSELFTASDIYEEQPINDPSLLKTLLSKGHHLRQHHDDSNHSHDSKVSSAPQSASSSNVEITIQGDKRCFTGDGLPNHDTGEFPNSGNPNQIKQQSIKLCVDAHPIKNNQINFNHRGSVGIALNGIQFRPSTADYYDANSPRGFSRDSSSGWNLEGIGARDQLGMDHQNAHVDHRGLYHYHSTPKSILSQNSTFIGYAADGFEIHYDEKQRSSYQLKQGIRPTEPGGSYDGKFVEDWVYKAGSGHLDQCNGGMIDNKFVYFATPTYPFFPRCFWGNPSDDFAVGQANRNNSQGRNARPRNSNTNASRSRNQRNQSPRTRACSSKSVGETCQFKTRSGREVSGSCQQETPEVLICQRQRRR